MKPLKGAKTAEKTSTIKVGRDSGRVRVFVRVRPPRPQESSRNEPTAVSTFELSSQIHISDPKHSWEKTFSFDHVFPQESTNPEVCNTISRPLVNAALNGFNGTLMAYGQTGSGKTHTLMAPDGITAGVIERCFKRISQDDYHDYKVTMSYLQIYQEKIYDLLNSTNKVELSLREHPTKGVYVENLSEYVVRSPTEVLSLLAVGKKRLIFAETKMNRTSSRSHSVCQLRIERTLNKSKVQGEGSGKDGVTKQGAANARDSKENPTACTRKSQVLSAKDTDEVTDVGGVDDVPVAKMVAFDDDVLIRGRIYLCDLAGSERLKKTHAEGERLSEAQHINSSLLELGNVIQALAEGKKTHVPFRNSTLTRLLQESLGGNCKTSLVVCVSPTASDVSETKCALFFGSRAMKITNTAYVNVEVDYQRLSEDLSKIVDMKERDLIELKQSYETRIERMKNEAETTVTNAVTEAEKVIASVKNLYENQQTDLQNQIQNLQTRLEEEKSRTESQQREIMEVRRKLQRDMYTSKSVLILDIISMQLLYAMKTLFVKDGASTSCNSGVHYNSTRIKILKNTDILLKLFKSYLSLMNSKGHELLENGATLRCVTDPKDLYEEPTALCDAEDMSLYLSNKTDDDKVVASSRCHETPNESRNDCVSCNSEVSDGNKEIFELKERLVSLKNNIDGEALEILSKAFELEEEHMNDTLERRENIYIRIMELIKTKNSLSATTTNTELSSLADSVALVDHCHSHVIVDKALQCALLLLENVSISKQSHDVWSQKSVVEKENQELKIQVQCLKKEAESLHGKLTETSSKLCDVKKSKEQLEDDLSSVFQLYNMKDNAKLEDRECTQCEMDGVSIPQKLQNEISTLVENNVKLKKELAATEKEKENLECELATTKKDFEREKAKSEKLSISCHCRSTQTEETVRALESTAARNEDLLERLFTVLHEDYSAPEKAASASQTNDIGDVSSLRTVINNRLGEEWSVLVLENAKMKSELENIRSRIVEERESFEDSLTSAEIEEFKKGKTNGVERNNKKGEMANSSLEFGKSSDFSDTKTLEIKIYDQNRVIAKLEMDKVDLIQGLQRFKQDAGNERQASSKGGNESNKAFDPQTADESSQADLSLGNILKEKLQELVRFQQENQCLQEELSTLRSKHKSIERDYNNSNKSTEKLEQKLEKLVESERQLSLKIVKMTESYGNLEGRLVRKSKENKDVREELKGMEQKVREIEQERDAIKHQKTVLEGILVEDVRRAERTLTLEREKRSACENALQEKTKELEEHKNMIKLSDNRLNKAESELNDAKKNYELLQESVKKFEEEQNNMIKEIKSLRCLQGLPAVKVKSFAATGPKKQTGAREDQKRQPNRQDNELNCELTRAKEQLLRLKAELTLSNMQTRNLGSQLSSLREDSTKLEAELSTVRVSPTKLRPRRNSFTYYDETVQLEMELGEAKGKIIELQEKLLSTYKEKFVLEETLTSFQTQTKTETARITETSKDDEKETATKDGGATTESPGDCKTYKPCEIEEDPAHEPRQDFDSEQRKMLEKRVKLLEEEKENLKKELEHKNADTCRLEELESCIQQLVSLEDEKLRLQRRLKQWAHNKTEDKVTTSAAREKPEHRKQLENNISLKKPAKKTFKSDLLADIEDLSTENCALQEEAENLKEKVIELEDALMALEFKMSIEDSVCDTASDKKALATVLASVKQERSELQKALQELLSEKDSMEEELEEMKAKYAKVQRELALTSLMKDELEADLLALRNSSLNRSLSSLTQSSDDCRSDRSSSSMGDLLFRNGDGCADESVQKARSVSLLPDKLALVGNGRKPVHCNTNGKTVTGNTKKDSRASGRLNSTSGAKQTEKNTPLSKPRNSAGSQATTTKASGRRVLPAGPRDKQVGKGFPRSDIVNSQSTTNNATHCGASYNLIRIDDDVTDTKFNTDLYSTDGGLFYVSHKGERQNPEGMETNISSLHETTLFDKNAVTINETDVLDEPYRNEVGFDIEHSGEVVVKTTWSLRNLFSRQKSLPLPDHDVAALRQ